jgi:peptidoglycan/xylan/chitin deacetylase (PgdA/CDA1 family)
MEIGSHLVDHVRAPALSPEALVDQMCESLERLTAMLQERPVSLAYPYGDYDETVVTAALNAGYRFGVTTAPGSNADVDEMKLRRLAVKGTRWYHPWQFRRRLTQRMRSATR